MTTSRWWLTLAVAAVIAGVSPASPADASGACPTLDDGVTVVVDFQGLGGGAVVRCAPGDPSTGLEALSGAGFDVEEVASWRGVVCRIDGRPGPEQEDCQDMPPGDAYWAYFHAERGGSWSYSTTGAGRHDPAVGSVEGWSFSEGGGPTPPRTAPPPAPEEPDPEPSPTREQPGPRASDTAPADEPETTVPSPTPSSDAGGEIEEEDSPPPPAPARALSPHRPTTSGTNAGHLGGGDAVVPSPSPSPEPVTASARATTEPEGGPGGAVVAAGLIAALVGVAFVLDRRRRRR